MSSTAIGQSWSSDQQLAFDISRLSNFDQEQLSTNGDQLWPLVWPSVTKILFRVYEGRHVWSIVVDGVEEHDYALSQTHYNALYQRLYWATSRK